MFEFINTLSESQLIPSSTMIKHYSADELADLVVLYVSGLYILYENNTTKQFAKDYASHTLRSGSSFIKWNNSSTDLYAFLFGLSSDVELDDPDYSFTFKDTLPFGKSALVQWLKDISRGSSSNHRTFFTRLDFNFKITNSSIRAVRRLAMDWSDLSRRERELTMTRILQMLKVRAPKSDILNKLQNLARLHNWEISDTEIEIKDDPKKKGSFLSTLAALGAAVAVSNTLDKGKRK